jgi:BRCT domain type II-containing protein
VERRGDDRADALAALTLWQQANKETTTFADIHRGIWLTVNPPIDADEVAERKKAARMERKKKAKKKLAANLAVAKALKAEQDGCEFNRTLERTGDT